MPFVLSLTTLGVALASLNQLLLRTIVLSDVPKFTMEWMK